MANFKKWLQMAVHLMGVNGALAHWNRGNVKTLFYHNVLPSTAAFPNALTPANSRTSSSLSSRNTIQFISTRAARSSGLRPTKSTS